MNEPNETESVEFLINSGYGVRVPEALITRVIDEGNEIIGGTTSGRTAGVPIRLRWMVLPATGSVVAAALLIALLMSGRSNYAWAESFDKLRSHPWIHVTADWQDAATAEGWIGADIGIVAHRTSDELRWDDVEVSQSLVYRKANKQLVRLPLTEQQQPPLDSRRFIDLLSKPDLTPAEFFGEFLLKEGTKELREIRQSTRNVTDANGSWREIMCDFAVYPNVGTDRVKTTMRIEKKTSLLRTVVIEMDVTSPADRSRRNSRLRIKFDYPKEGPARHLCFGSTRWNRTGGSHARTVYRSDSAWKSSHDAAVR